MSLAVVVIATEKRRALLPQIMASMQDADELIVVGEWEEEYDTMSVGYVHVPPVTRTTIDALMKRDVGWLVTRSDTVCFLSDDHKLAPNFVQAYRQIWEPKTDWDFLRPSRYTIREKTIVQLNNGSDQYGEYCGGHAGLYRRHCAAVLPWMQAPHHLNWDLIKSRQLVDWGMKMAIAGPELAVEDIEIGARPWE